MIGEAGNCSMSVRCLGKYKSTAGPNVEQNSRGMDGRRHDKRMRTPRRRSTNLRRGLEAVQRTQEAFVNRTPTQKRRQPQQTTQSHSNNLVCGVTRGRSMLGHRSHSQWPIIFSSSAMVPMRCCVLKSTCDCAEHSPVAVLHHCRRKVLQKTVPLLH